MFLSVEAHLSFSRAANELDMTPSPISHAIWVLERRLNVRLFNRTMRSVSLTDAGERLASKLRQAMASIGEAIRELEADDHSPSGTVRINASEGAIRLVWRPVLARFLREYPQVHLDIVSDGKLCNIVVYGFDAGILLAEAVPKDTVAISVSEEVRFAVVVSPEYFDQRGYLTVPHDLHRHDCIRVRFESSAIYRWELGPLGAVERFNVSGPLTLTDQPMMVEAAIDGISIAFVPEHLTANALKGAHSNEFLKIGAPAPGLCLYYSGHRHLSSDLRAPINMLTETLSDNKSCTYEAAGRF